MRLTTGDHDRRTAGMTYVYPVVSRRAGGVSIGVNLNPNRACNWRCVYCQVPELARGAAPRIDLELLERELEVMLRQASAPAWLAKSAPHGMRRLSDVALSGDGEPTTSRQIGEVVERIGAVLARRRLLGRLKVVLITNGSMVHRPDVRGALARLEGMNGEVWFKLDGASESTLRRLNSTRTRLERHVASLSTAASLCPTWVQTLVLDRGGPSLDEAEQRSYVELLARLVRQGVPLRGVLLYGLARPSHQPEAGELRALPEAWLEDFARRIEAGCRLPVRVSP